MTQIPASLRPTTDDEADWNEPNFDPNDTQGAFWEIVAWLKAPLPSELANHRSRPGETVAYLRSHLADHPQVIVAIAICLLLVVGWLTPDGDAADPFSWSGDAPLEAPGGWRIEPCGSDHGVELACVNHRGEATGTVEHRRVPLASYDGLPATGANGDVLQAITRDFTERRHTAASIACPDHRYVRIGPRPVTVGGRDGVLIGAALQQHERTTQLSVHYVAVAGGYVHWVSGGAVDPATSCQADAVRSVPMDDWRGFRDVLTDLAARSRFAASG